MIASEFLRDFNILEFEKREWVALELDNICEVPKMMFVESANMVVMASKMQLRVMYGLQSSVKMGKLRTLV
jgi:anaerobic selenocysteine-containing dehydrogenase